MPDTSISLTLKITDPMLLAGVAHACALFNEALPQEQKTDADGNPVTSEDGSPVYVMPKPGALDGKGYLTFVVNAALRSYARQKILADFDAGDMTGKQRDAALSALE